MNIPVKILIIRFSSIGDIVLTSPAIRCLKNQLEGDVELHYLTKEVYLELLEHNPHLSKVYTIKKSTNEVIEQLQAENYDYVIDLHKNLRSLRVKNKLKALAFSFDKLNFKKWLLVNFKINRMPDVHIVDRYIETAKALGIENDGEGLDYFLPAQVGDSIPIPDEFRENYVALVLGANHATKKLPLHKLKSLVESSRRKFVLIGGINDRPAAEELIKIDEKRIFNACGIMNLNQSAYLLQQADTVITPDTGMMHIAAAFQKQIISVWGNTVPEFGMYPYLKKAHRDRSTIMEVKGLSCRPCSKIGFEKCPKGHFKCMENIELKEILAKVG